MVGWPSQNVACIHVCIAAAVRQTRVTFDIYGETSCSRLLLRFTYYTASTLNTHYIVTSTPTLLHNLCLHTSSLSHIFAFTPTSSPKRSHLHTVTQTVSTISTLHVNFKLCSLVKSPSIIMSESTSDQELRLTRHRKLQNGMELILGKLRHNAKSITAEDARSLADNAEDGDDRTANVIAAVQDIAARNEAEKTAVNNDHPRSSSHISQSALNVSQNVIERLRNDPSSITEEDARRFSENVEVRDASTARLVSAVESLAAAHKDIYGGKISLGQSLHPSLLTVVKDLYAAVETNPGDVNTEILRTTQSIVSS